jgi:predicted DNA-binding transcriptional regulator YafY
MVGVADTGARTLRLLSLLQNQRAWGGPELADRLGVSTRTLRRDVERLRDLGYPVEAQRGVDGGYRLTAGAAMPPLVLDDEEAVAIGVGMQTAVQAGTVAGIADSAVRALAKLAQVMPPALRRRINALSAVTVPAGWGAEPSRVDPGALATVAQAARNEERLAFSYTARDGERSDRRVEPHRLVLLGRRWYLVAWDLDREDWRSFRLDRLVDPRTTGAPFRSRPIPGADAAEFVRQSIDQLPTNYTVEVRIHASLDEVRSRVGGWASLESDSEGCVMTMTTDSLDWPAMALGSIGADFTVISPPELAAHLRDWADRFGRAVG